MPFRRLFPLLLIFLAACNVLVAPTATPTATFTPVPSDTPTPTLTYTPSQTFTPSLTPTETLTPSPTLTPSNTPTETPIPTPTNTPAPVALFTYDNWGSLSVANDITARLNSPLIAFLNSNNRTGQAGTPRPGNDIQTLYYINPASGVRTEIQTFDRSTGRDIFIAPTGDAYAWMQYLGTAGERGLYVADLALNFAARVLPIDTLVQRGVISTPSWAADGSRFAIAMSTAYDMDIFTIDRGGAYQRITESGAYDFHPVFSPDGRYIAFISDRATCPSWIPGEPGTCDGTDTPPPTGGNVYVIELATGAITRVSDAYVTEPPTWINPRMLTFASTEPLTDPLLSGNVRDLWRVDVVSGDARRVRLQSGDTPLKLSESWSPDGQMVVFQAPTSSTTDIVLAQFNGTELGRITDLAFARYAMIAAWSPDGQRIAIGGVSGQCPYGIVVRDAALDQVARGNPPPTMCNPAFSPDGRWLAFDGVTPNVDGRIDVWVANSSGFGGTILTGTLRGQLEFLGWVGG